MCVSPIQILYVDTFGNDQRTPVPCGKCIECLKDKQNSWKIRIQEEARNHLYTYFFTLTYRDESAPKVDYGRTYYVVDKSHIQKWLKRARTNLSRTLKRDIDLVYFICSEYGPNTGRGHYHGVLMTDVSPTFIASVFNDWRDRFGFFKYSRVNPFGSCSDYCSPASAGNYIAKYCNKIPVLFTPIEVEIYDLIKEGVLPSTFHLCSKGLGLSYVNSLKSYHLASSSPRSERIGKVCDRAFYHQGSFKYKLPRYYKERLYFDKVDVGSKFFNFKTNQYEFKKVKRYKKVSSFSRQVSDEIRSRILAEDMRAFEEFKSKFSHLSDSEVSSLFCRSRENSKEDRRKDCFSKLSRFYNSNRHKGRRFRHL